MVSFDIKTFWNLDFLRSKGRSFSYDVEDRIEKSIVFLEASYWNYLKFKDLSWFSDYLLEDAVKSDIDSWGKVWFYPITEVKMELDNAIKHALIWSYKSSLADLRRAIELMVVHVYFSLDTVPKNESVSWFKSEYDTPMMKKMLAKVKS